MGDSSFGPMWPTQNPYSVTIVRNDGLRLSIHKELAEMVQMLMDITEEILGYDIHPGETWGGANRPISGTNTPSNHSQYTAIDINAPSNPYASVDWHRRNARGTKPFGLQIVCDIPQAVIELWEKYGWRWGGKYSTKVDPMHFEFMGTVNDARRLTIALRQWYDEQGVWNMAAEEKLDTLIVATRRQTHAIIKQAQLGRKADLNRERRQAERDGQDTTELVTELEEVKEAIAALDAKPEED